MGIGATYWWNRLTKRDRREQQLDAELRFHFDEVVAANLRAGMKEAEALRCARLELGGIDQVKEECRDAWALRWIEDLIRDLRFAARSLRKSPAFTITAVLTLALGIGLNTAIFSVVNAVLLKPLPFPDPERIVVFQNTSGAQGTVPRGVSPAKFNAWTMETSSFQDISAYRWTKMNMTGLPDPEQITAAQVSAGFFRLFGVAIARGRAFTSEEDMPNTGHVAVLEDGFWQRRFGGDPKIIGRTISLNGAPYLVLGITSPGAFSERLGGFTEPDALIPLQVDPASADQVNGLAAGGRLRPRVTLSMAAAEMKVLSDRYRRKYPNALRSQDGFSVRPMPDDIVGDVRSQLLILTAAVVFVLLVACVNVASLLIARASARSREVAIRAAIGASRGRILRQLLAENLLLCVMSGILALATGLAADRIMLSSARLPRVAAHASNVVLDWRVFLFTCSISLGIGIGFGLLAGFPKSALSTEIKSNRNSPGKGFNKTKVRHLLVIGEVAFAAMLLMGAALMIRTFTALRSTDAGLDPHGVMTTQMLLGGMPRFETASGIDQLIQDGLRRVRVLPGLQDASAACCLPMQGRGDLRFTIVGRPLTGPFHGRALYTYISPGYFKVFGIPVVRGRDFTDRDDRAAPHVVIINQTMARQFWQNRDPLGEYLFIGKGVNAQLDKEPPAEIIGITGDVREAGLDRDPGPAMYVPMAQTPESILVGNSRLGPIVWAFRSAEKSQSPLAGIAKELQEASGGIPVGSPRSMEEIVGQSIAQRQVNTLLMTVFGCSALLLAAIGIYGLVAYIVQQRTQEIGVRIAVGAAPSGVRNMVVAQGMRLALAGVALGIAAAYGLTRFLGNLLYGVAPHDLATFVVMPTILLAVALFACWIPARVATRINPSEALRCE